MSELVLGVRLTADGKGLVGEVRATEEQVKRLKETVKSTNEQALVAANQYTMGLKRQADTLGMSRSQLTAYEASQHQLTSAQRESVAASRQAIDAHEQMKGRLEGVQTAARLAGAAIGAFMVKSLRDMTAATMQAEQASLRLEAVLKATGHAAGLTRAELDEMAESMQRRLGFDDEEVRDAAAKLLLFRNVSRESFGGAMEAAANLSRALGTDLQSSILMVGKALQDPEEGITQLNRSLRLFDDSQKETLQGLADMGDQAEAMTMILRIMKERGLDGVAQAMNQELWAATNKVKIEWEELLEALGRTESVGGAVEKKLGLLSDWLGNIRRTVENGDWVDKLLGIMTLGLRPVESGWRGSVGGSEARLAREGAQKKFADDTMALLDEALGELSDLRAKESEKAAEEYKQRVAASAQYIESLKLEIEQIGLSAIQQKRLGMERMADKAGTAEQRKAVLDLAGAWAIATQAELDRVAAVGLSNKEAENAIALDEERRLAVEEGYRATRKTIEQIQFETQLLGLNNTEREIAIALRDLETRGIEKGSVAYEEFARRLREALAAKGVREAQIETGKEAGENWKRTVDNIDKTFRDGFTRMLEAGKSGWKAWSESLRNTFKTEVADQIYRMFLQPFVLRIVAAVGGSLGLSGLASAASGGTGGGGGLGMAGGLSNLSSLVTGGSIGTGLATLGGYLPSWMGGTLGTGIMGPTALGGNAAGGIFANAGMVPNWQYGLAGLGGSLLGGAIGGKTGATLGGIGSTIGMALGGPIGAVIGSVGGGVLGKVFGGGSGPKKVGHRLVGELSMEEFVGQGYKVYKGGKQKGYGNIDYENSMYWAQGAVEAFSTRMKGILDYGKQLGLNTSELAKTLAAVRVPIDITKGKNEWMPPKVIAAANAAADALEKQFIPALLEAAERVKQLGAREQELMARDIPNLLRDVRGRLGIDALTAAQQSLRIAEFNAPLDRIAAVRAQLGETYTRGIGGDLGAVSAFPQMLQSALSIGRDVFASGAGFQEIFREGTQMLNDLLSRQRDLETDILSDVPITIKEAAQDQIAALRAQTNAVVAELREVRAELVRLREAA